MPFEFDPFAGSPLFPPAYVTWYFIVFFSVLFVAYIYVYRKRRPILLWHKVKLLVVLAVLLKALAIGGGGLLAAYWLVPTPHIETTNPQKETSTFSPTDRIEVIFDRPVDRSLLEKSISPDVPGRWVFENSLYTTHLYRKVVFYPTYSLRPDTTYTVKMSQIRNLIKVSKPYEYQFSFTTHPAPTVASIAPSAEEKDVAVETDITLTLDHPNDRVSEFYVRFDPPVDYDLSLDETKKIYTIDPTEPLTHATTYTLVVQKSDTIINLDDASVVERGPTKELQSTTFTTASAPEGFLETVRKTFASIGVPGVSSITPQDGLNAVSISSPIRITFNREVDHKTLERRFTLTPETPGSFAWEGNTLVFTPEQSLKFSTAYTVAVGADTLSTFTTQHGTTKLAVPAYLQKYTLSCEIAALRMALNYRGVNVGEDDIIPHVGTDPTPHNGGVWGNPNNAFVGNIRGTQMKDGYGVHWAPIAKAARNYRNALDFQNWRIEQLTQELLNDNPVVIWVYSHYGTPTSWKTPDGTDIYAVRDEHAVVAVGFVGPADNPTELVINDPLVGQVHWSRATFDKKWGIFNNSGVVVY